MSTEDPLRFVRPRAGTGELDALWDFARWWSPELTVLGVLCLVAVVGAACRWPLRQFCAGAAAMPVAAFAAFTWPVGPTLLVLSVLAWSTQRRRSTHQKQPAAGHKPASGHE